ncbi:uncharacterized protein ASPGLDRAFT_944566 [Aspergillus glaucus CBS 516.65]|uniref:Reverse transcriptase domain-containing protein n=1 Tax=Aspergillus glaucus CBS 516.65 TaxID=1160497 RepID=A0A1L9V6M6_ASPGL|nr:hypothetical protein ASPGLDRAFT_944566 [Aspergillus glaucus CBS 516.65]OJJ79573.1 hypothetical protein ASPGLDRAFT_944566 [Aspergillus glaucus CBS 516.65]
MVERSVAGVQSLSFADDIGLLASGHSVKEVCDKLQKAAKVAIEWGHDNVVQFDAGKTEAVLLTRKWGRELKDQIERARVEVDGHHVPFNPEATRWLGIWLDSGLNLKAHHQTCMRKARAAENRVQRLCQSHGLAPGLARQVQVAAVQSVALYGAELWWQGQKDRLAGIQLMVNRQARAITGMLKSTPVGPLVREAGLAPAEALLEARQLRYTTRLLSLPENHPAKKILPVSFREGDQHTQPGEQSPARQLANILPADPSEGFESTIQTASSHHSRTSNLVRWIKIGEWQVRSGTCVRSLTQSFLELFKHSKQQRKQEIRDQSLYCWTPKPPLRDCDIPSQGQAKH